MSDHTELLNEIYERALAERAVTCDGWMWGGGMLVSIPPADDRGPRSTKRLVDGERIDPDSGMLPIFRDASTRGCLLALVRHAFGKKGLVLVTNTETQSGERRWCVLASNNARAATASTRTKREWARAGAYYATTEEEALVAALERSVLYLGDQGEDGEQ